MIGEVYAVLQHLHVVETLPEAVSDADYVQQSVLERIDVKMGVCREIASAMRPEGICGSSTSGIPASQFTADIIGRERFLVVHPVNPPHLIPLVELVAAPSTEAAVVHLVRREMRRIGQSPIVINSEIDGFVLNRLQGAQLN